MLPTEHLEKLRGQNLGRDARLAAISRSLRELIAEINATRDEEDDDPDLCEHLDAIAARIEAIDEDIDHIDEAG